ncbi:hypothetical protein L1887_31680 [Cichorium endivia]|nr:hypothetical protein L1887_31680 [Cichorium endivia]
MLRSAVHIFPISHQPNLKSRPKIPAATKTITPPVAALTFFRTTRLNRSIFIDSVPTTLDHHLHLHQKDFDNDQNGNTK